MILALFCYPGCTEAGHAAIVGRPSSVREGAAAISAVHCPEDNSTAHKKMHPEHASNGMVTHVNLVSPARFDTPCAEPLHGRRRLQDDEARHSMSAHVKKRYPNMNAGSTNTKKELHMMFRTCCPLCNSFISMLQPPTRNDAPVSLALTEHERIAFTLDLKCGAAPSVHTKCTHRGRGCVCSYRRRRAHYHSCCYQAYSTVGGKKSLEGMESRPSRAPPARAPPVARSITGLIPCAAAHQANPAAAAACTPIPVRMTAPAPHPTAIACWST